MFFKLLIVKKYYSPTQYHEVGLYNEKAVVFLWGKKWTVNCYLYKIQDSNMRSRYKERSHTGYVTLSRLYAQPTWTHNHTVSLTLILGSGRSFSGAAVMVPYTKHIKEQLCGIKILNRTLQQSGLMVPFCDTRSRGTESNLDSVRDWLEVASETGLSFPLFVLHPVFSKRRESSLFKIFQVP